MTQIEANKRWRDKNKEYSNYISCRSHARSFIRTKATLSDLAELTYLINEKKQSIIEGANLPWQK